MEAAVEGLGFKEWKREWPLRLRVWDFMEWKRKGRILH